MSVIADLHIHSKYSRATSEKMDISTITHYAHIKGLNLLGTGDFTHPLWMRELKNSLVEVADTGLYSLKEASQTSVYFMLTTEVSIIFTFEGKVRKIHNLILAPSIEVAEQINDVLKTQGDLSADGRPTFGMSAPELVEKIIAVSDDNLVIPAHAWTPWFSLFGSINGFDSLEDCYQDMTKKIFALETGLSSDPPMNWRLSALDKYCLVSNSDSHSPYPYRIGREANVFEFKELSYKKIIESIRSKDSETFKFTIETDPAYGKYHWTGHRNCNVSMSPEESRRLAGKCPVCHRSLTRGVEERVEDLADRPPKFKPDGAIGYVHLLPLQEIIGTVLGTENLSTSAVWTAYNALTSRFGDEYRVLLDVPQKELEKATEPRIAEAIINVREDRVKVIPGYDGVYGKMVLKGTGETEDRGKAYHKDEGSSREQTSLERFM